VTATLHKAMPTDVAAAFREFPAPVRKRLERVRALILSVAGETEGVGPLVETLKWGEPAYLTEATGSGSTIRLGWYKARPSHAAVYFNCKTTLVSTFRDLFPSVFEYSGDRAILLDVESSTDEKALSLCISAALTYHLAKNPKKLNPHPSRPRTEPPVPRQSRSARPAS
jgi:Domain of unknown function (DU1801)